MNVFDILILPFVFIYRGFVLVLLLPYYLVVLVVKAFKPNKTKVSNTIPEIKPGEKVKVIKGTRSAYDTPKVPVKNVDPAKQAEEKNKEKLKRQKNLKD